MLRLKKKLTNLEHNFSHAELADEIDNSRSQFVSHGENL